ncbi:uncharacterized protein LOC108849037 isoform X2 [Raphanus sativus]|uniref:Uncharacterized protein LOC108849037 isoform X2 n=1 Tax=Raphanus sativus TaxID=3726 RepID=A0A9W3DR33_RAPSA|nr:uncharacterized protein LOC108849037 isoform X2 [Raphanus sativus]
MVPLFNRFSFLTSYVFSIPWLGFFLYLLFVLILKMFGILTGKSKVLELIEVDWILFPKRRSATIPEVDCVRKALSDKKKGLGSGTQQFGTADVLANDDSPDDCEILAFARTQGVIALH